MLLNLLLLPLFSSALAENVIPRIQVQPARIKKGIPSSCSPKYASLGSSTMCQYEDNPQARNTGVNKVMQIVIVAEHNKYRRKVGNPTATNMQKMYWDPEIAAIAQKWANTCPNGHDTNDNRKVPGYGIHIGQNWASGYRTWDKAVKAWYDEVKMYRYGQDPDTYLANGFMEIGHYTQVVRDVAARVGCGYAECPGLSRVYVCNYAFGNPFDFGKPYESGPKCGACPKSCKSGLCDCGGKICKNGGTLDPNTCSCSCPDLWTGDQCDKLNCPARDPEVCGAAWGYAPRRCKEWSNVPQECPIMCGVCKPGPNSVLPSFEEMAVENAVNNGERPIAKAQFKVSNLEMCQAVDPDHCGQPQPYGFLPQHCRQWINVPDECPAMCGRCRALCDGKTSAECKHGGQLQASTCRCKCTAPYSGDHCETLASCPAADPADCAEPSMGYSASQCDVMAYVREHCPIMCKLCTERCPGRTADSCANGGTLREDCTCACAQGFTGDDCRRFEKCPRSKDEFWCGQFSKSDCLKYYNFPTDCPYMCNTC